jgi:sulfate transport system permease protein
MAEAVLRARKEVETVSRVPYGAWGLRAAALTYLVVLVAVPLLIIAFEGLRYGWETFWDSINQPVALSAIWLSVWTAALMAVINTVMGTLTAYVLVHYRFPGKRLLDTIIDLPFAIPTLVTGVMLVLLYGPQTVIGGFFQQTFGVRILFAPPGIVLALMFISYPFVIRAVQPVLAKLDINQEEAAHTLGASGWTTFRRIVLPAILPAMITGGMLSFARALGEFGSIVIVAGNIPQRTQVATVYIFGQVEGGNLSAASAVSLVMLLIALVATLTADWMMRRRARA